MQEMDPKHLPENYPSSASSKIMDTSNGDYGKTRMDGTHPDVENPEVQQKKRSLGDLINKVASSAAVCELVSIALGKVGFVCATVVLLSGYYGLLQTFHFWFVASLLLIKAARLLTSQHELQLRTKVIQCDSYWRSKSLDPSCDDARKCNCELKNQYPLQQHRSRGINLNAILYVMQILASLLCVSLSLVGIVKVKDYGETKHNQSVPVLAIFYSVVLVESILFISARAVWETRKHFLDATITNLFSNATAARLKHKYFLNQYAYYVYCKCIDSSIFEGTHFTLLDFTFMKISSDIHDEQHSSVLIMENILEKRYNLEVIKVFSVLLEIVSWDTCRVMLTSEDVREARQKAAEILLQVVKLCPTSCYTLASIPGAFEAIFSLTRKQTCDSHGSQSSRQDELSLQGLRMLNDMGKNPRNILKIGFVHNLIKRLSEYLEESHGEPFESKKKALQLLNKLAETEHKKQISKYAMENLCSMVRNEVDLSLKKLAICILTSLAMDAKERDKIGSTGYIIPTLCNLYFVEDVVQSENEKRVKNSRKVRQYAGDALYILSQPHRMNKNWCRILGNMPGYDENNLSKFINLLSDKDMKIRRRSAKILTNVLGHIDMKAHPEALSSAFDKSLTMMVGISEMEQELATMVVGISEMEQELAMVQESALHILTCLARYFGQDELKKIMHHKKVLERLLDTRPDAVPCLRRHAVSLAVTLMEKDVNLMHGMRIEEKLKNLIKTISGSENFCELVRERGKEKHKHVLWKERSTDPIEDLITRGLGLLKP